jgi:hypothetical protein
VFPRDMVCLGNICINTLHKGAKDDDDDDDDDNNNNNKLIIPCLNSSVISTVKMKFLILA